MSAAHENNPPPSTDGLPPEGQTLPTQHASGTPLPVEFPETIAPTAAAAPPVGETPAQTLAGYEILSELGRGGMGVVYRARQTALGRLVALKMILHADYASAEERQRFQREARALGGLRHEGIVQVYEVGEHNGKPFFSLEYVEGGSLDKHLAGTPLPPKEAARLVQQLAAAMQAAHEAGIVHRDLKPANVLLASGGCEPPVRSSTGGSHPPLADCVPKITDFGLAKTQDEGNLSVSGAVLGTPSYMAPEQAAGRVHDVDGRTDVYALGAILYECLTGRPPFRAATVMDTLMQVLHDEPVPVRALQPATPQDLETICLKCLHKEPGRRYASARELADELGRFLRGEPVLARPVGRLERLRKWVWRRPTAAGLLAALVLLVTTGSIGAWLVYRQRSAARDHQAQTDRQVRAVLAPARDLLEESWQVHDLAQLKKAEDEGDRALGIARSGGASAAVQEEAEAFREDAGGRLRRARKTRALLEEVLEVSAPLIASAQARDAGRMLLLDHPSQDRQYAAAFRRWGLNVDGTAEAEVVAQLAAEPDAVLQELIAAVDNWMLERRKKGPEVRWRRLFRVAEQLDRNERSRRLRALLVGGGPPRADSVAGLVGVGSPWLALWELGRGSSWRQLHEVRKEINPRTEPALTVVLLARAFTAVGDSAAAEQVLLQTVTARPKQVVLLRDLGQLLEAQGPSRFADAIGCYRAARALRPHLGISLSRVLFRAGQVAQAEDVLQDLILRQPKNPVFYYHLGIVLYGEKKDAAAQKVIRKAIDLNPSYAEAHYSLGVIFLDQQKFSQAEAIFRKAVHLKGDFAAAFNNLGAALAGQGKLDKAEAALRKAIDLAPDLAPAQNNFGHVLLRRRKYGQAEAALRKAIALKADFALAYYNLATALRMQQKFRDAEAAYRKAIASRPDPETYQNLGNALSQQGKHAEAEAAYRESLRRNPARPEAHYSLGKVLNQRKKFSQAEAALRKALDLQPGLGLARYELGVALIQQARFDEAAAAFRKAGELLPEQDPFRERARGRRQLCQRYALLDARLPAILQGKDKPASAAEQLEFARVCHCKERYAAAARFTRDAFTAEPKLAENVPPTTRLQAACAAAMAGCGQGEDAAGLNDKERVLWRRQALEWLRLDLTLCGKALDNGEAQTKAEALWWMRHWQNDDHLAGVRAEEALARLPDEERRQWQRLWSDVEALLRRASAPE